MIQCARLALIDSDIMTMPMGYQTLIGETGGGLSGAKTAYFIGEGIV